MIYDNNTYKLGSGRILHANDGVLGLGPSADVLYDGYDGHRHRDSPDGSTHDDGRHLRDLTSDERYEVAAEMIWRWFRWSRPESATPAAPQAVPPSAPH